MTPQHERAFAVRIDSVPDEKPRRGCRVAMELARVLAIPLGEARALLDRAPATTPRRMGEAAARELAASIADMGASAAPLPLGIARGKCATHATFDADALCARCEARVCSVCNALARESLCGVCLAKKRRSRAFRNARVSVLLGVLVIVLLYAWNDVRRRRQRTDWTRTLDVALIVLRRGPVDPAAIERLKARARDLDARLAAQMKRYRAGPPPFSFHVEGPVDVVDKPPSGAGESFSELVQNQYAQWRFLSHVNAQAGVDPGAYASRVYLVVEPPRGRRELVEGESEAGGRVGVVSVDLGDDMVDFALFVATHELLHTLGATDKYDAAGRALAPQGLGDPDRLPLYPQADAEVMARNIVMAPGRERPPETLDELVVGRWTAREIGWAQSP